MRIASVVASAGQSRRMGAFKPLLSLWGAPVIHHVIQALEAAGVSETIVVVGHREGELTAALSGLDVRIARNPHYAHTGMLESIQIGIASLSPFDAVFLLPGDMPAISPATLCALADAYAQTRSPVCRPVFEGRFGHPPLLSAEAANAVLSYRGEGGLRAALKPFSTRAHPVRTNDPGCLLGLNTPDDFAELSRLLTREELAPMQPISRPVSRKDHSAKASGAARYAADLPREDVQTTRIIRSTRANARLLSIAYPPLPAGYYIADGRDLPRNEADLHALDKPVFATRHVRYVGEAIAIVAGPDPAEVERIVRETRVDYAQEGPVVTSIDEATETFFTYSMEKGDVDSEFAQADFIFEEVFHTGRQEQAYLEPQALEASCRDGVLTITGSLQCPYYIVGALKHAFHLEDSEVRVIQATTGGGFGGKEEYPSLLACQVAAAARKSGKPCRISLARQEDMAVTTKRHPSRIALKASVQNGRVTALDVSITLDGGAYKGLSDVVLQRSMFCCSGVYAIDNLRVLGRVVMTNTPLSGAFRGFGAPQSFFAIETFMSHIATKLHADPVAFKRAHFVRQGDLTATSGIFHEKVPLEAMLDQVLTVSGYAKKRAAYAKGEGSLRRGIGLSFVFHGCGFTGNGERDVIRAKVRLEKHEDGTVTILGANAEIGQGLATTFPKVVAQTLGIPLEQVHYPLPDTKIAPDSGPTVASRSMMVVGRLLERAARRLQSGWQDGKAQAVEECYVDPPHRLPFDMDVFRGDAYPAYAWAVNAVEVEVDRRTMLAKVLNVYALFDCGTPIDYHVLRGQAEGGIAQGLGYAGMEVMDVDASGRIRQDRFTDYALPTAMDIPAYHVAFYDDPYEGGPFGARGAGELTLVGAAPAYAAAVEQALCLPIHRLPLSPESLMALSTVGISCEIP